MVATWAVGRDCTPDDLGDKLSKAPFDFVLLVMSTAVADTDAVFVFLSDLARVQALPLEEREESPPLLLKVLQEKTVHGLGCTTHPDQCKAFIALHKAKIVDARYEEFHLRSCGPDSGLQFGTLKLNMDQSRQRMSEVSVGIIDVRSTIDKDDTDALVSWVILERIDMLTGFFGNHVVAEFVADLATRTKAISWTPMYQAIRSRGAQHSWAHPSFFLFFGFYRAITVPEDVTEVSDTLNLGVDIWEDMLRLKDMPEWQRNDQGSAFVQNLGHVKMKPPDWKRWFDGCFQTCLWLGTATPSRKSQEKGKGKGKCKGKGK